MKLLTKNTDYAITALCHVAEGDQETYSVSDLAGELKISHSFLRKILQDLRKAGILNSRKGTGGGFSLALSPDRIPVYDIISVFQGDVLLTECAIRGKVCHRLGDCALQRRLNQIERRLISDFKALTIESLIS